MTAICSCSRQPHITMLQQVASSEGRHVSGTALSCVYGPLAFRNEANNDYCHGCPRIVRPVGRGQSKQNQRSICCRKRFGYNINPAVRPAAPSAIGRSASPEPRCRENVQRAADNTGPLALHDPPGKCHQCCWQVRRRLNEPHIRMRSACLTEHCPSTFSSFMSVVLMAMFIFCAGRTDTHSLPLLISSFPIHTDYGAGIRPEEAGFSQG